MFALPAGSWCCSPRVTAVLTLAAAVLPADGPAGGASCPRRSRPYRGKAPGTEAGPGRPEFARWPSTPPPCRPSCGVLHDRATPGDADHPALPDGTLPRGPGRLQPGTRTPAWCASSPSPPRARPATRASRAAAGRAGGVCQVDGGRRLAFEGPATVTDDPERVAEAVAATPRPLPQLSASAPDRVAIEIAVDRASGWAGSTPGTNWSPGWPREPTMPPLLLERRHRRCRRRRRATILPVVEGHVGPRCRAQKSAPPTTGRACRVAPPRSRPRRGTRAPSARGHAPAARPRVLDPAVPTSARRPIAGALPRAPSSHPCRHCERLDICGVGRRHRRHRGSRRWWRRSRRRSTTGDARRQPSGRKQRAASRRLAPRPGARAAPGPVRRRGGAEDDAGAPGPR